MAGTDEGSRIKSKYCYENKFTAKTKVGKKNPKREMQQ